MRPLRLALMAALVAAAPAAQAQPPQPAAGQTAAPSAIDLLFEDNHFETTAPGSTIRYRYHRFSGIADGPFGPPVEDTVREIVAAGPSPETRNLTVEAYTGERRLPTARYENMSGNPLLAQFLEYHTLDMGKALKGNPRYLKNAIRKALRDAASVTPAEVEVQGVKQKGWRVEIRPFLDDPVKDKLRGFDTLTYTFVVSPAVPGEIVSIDVQATAPDGGTLYRETLTYEPSVG